MSEDKGRVALVIGGGAGIGFASAQALAGPDTTLIIADRDGDSAERAAERLQAYCARTLSFQADASSLDQLRALFDFVDAQCGRLNVLLSNAGMTGPNGLDVTEADFDAVFNLNVKSHFFATNYARPLLCRGAPAASVIYMSSTAGLRYHGPSPLYSISKSSILMLARAFARELGGDGIRVNALCPGHVRTDFPRRWLGLDGDDYEKAAAAGGEAVPLGRIGLPGDVAGAVAFLASDQSMYISGVSIPIEGGLLA